MEISGPKKGEFKLKGKKVSVLITPSEIQVENYKIFGPGEYEISGVDVIGLAGGVFRISVDGVSVGIITRKLAEEEKSRLGTVNVVVTPAELELDTSLEPSYVIPFGETEMVAKFAKGLGTETVTPVPKLVASPDRLPETTTVVVLE
jgi:hypothetical protein